MGYGQLVSRLTKCPKQIFFYGGRASDLATTIAQGAVYSLSLPSFHWQRHSASPERGRYEHTCNVADPDGRNRQMLVIGGFLATADSAAVVDLDSGLEYTTPPDPWPHGVGVFDLASLEWKDGFDADAGEYVTPDGIREYNQRNGPAPAAGWTEDDVEAWFQEARTATTTATPPPVSSDADAQQRASSTSAGAIAGGVVGGLAALACLVATVWFLRRRRRGPQNSPRALRDYGGPGVEHRIHELAEPKQARVEMEGKGRTAELEAERSRHELPGSER